MKSIRTVVATAILSLTLLLAVVSYMWLPHDPSYASASITWLRPSSIHWLGTDGSGRDIASRLIIGSRVTVLVTIGTGLLAGTLGLLLAIPQALGPRFVREPLAVLIDVLIAFPTLLVAIMLTAVFGAGIPIVIIVVGIGYGVQIARVMKAELRQVAGSDFVMAARAAGLSRWRILTKHLIPSIAPVLFVQLSLSMGLAVLAESSLSYLGFGAPRDMPSWGTMLAETQRYIGVHPEVVLWPGLAITLVVLAFYLLGDALRENLDSTLKRSEEIARRTQLGVQA